MTSSWNDLTSSRKTIVNENILSSGRDDFASSPMLILMENTMTSGRDDFSSSHTSIMKIFWHRVEMILHHFLCWYKRKILWQWVEIDYTSPRSSIINENIMTSSRGDFASSLMPILKESTLTSRRDDLTLSPTPMLNESVMTLRRDVPTFLVPQY